jgi:hypothetical protein
MLVSRLIPLVVMAGIGAHSGGAIKDRMSGALTARDKLVTKQRMMVILEAVRLEAVDGDEIVFKSDGQLRAFVKKNVRLRGKGDPSVDFWGTPFRAENGRGGMTLSSAGKDKKFGTRDDIKTTENVYDL